MKKILTVIYELSNFVEEYFRADGTAEIWLLLGELYCYHHVSPLPHPVTHYGFVNWETRELLRRLNLLERKNLADRKSTFFWYLHFSISLRCSPEVKTLFCLFATSLDFEATVSSFKKVTPQLLQSLKLFFTIFRSLWFLCSLKIGSGISFRVSSGVRPWIFVDNFGVFLTSTID